ncbi:MAG: hypothetical protein HQM10_11360 [Candidatus Riflebacteria bacterium]|nr:hypothetical protein [Candidatus Riflebacteria bacterium]
MKNIKCFIFSLLICSILFSEKTLSAEAELNLPPIVPQEVASQSLDSQQAIASQPKKVSERGKVERSLGLGYFRMDGYTDFVEPRLSFIKRKNSYSEVVEYSWRPMFIKDMPNKERIDRVQFTINRYYFTSPAKKFFYGGGLGGNFIFFNKGLKDWGKERSIDLKDGINGLARLFIGWKISEFKFLKTVYPLVFRVDASFSPPYKFGGTLGRAGEEIKLTQIFAGLSFSIE